MPNVRESSGTAFLYAASSVHGKRRKANLADTLSAKRTWRVRVRRVSWLLRLAAEWFGKKFNPSKNRNADEQSDNDKHVLGGNGHFSYQSIFVVITPVTAPVGATSIPSVPGTAMYPRKSIIVVVFAIKET